MAYGVGGHIGLGKEAVWGTPVAVTNYMAALSESLALTRDRFDVQNIVGGRLAESEDVAGIFRIEGDLVVPGFPSAAGFLINGAFGGPWSSTTVTSGFLNTVEFRSALTDVGSKNPLPPYTLEIFRDVTTNAFQYSGAQVSKLGMQVQPNQELRLTATMVCKQSTVITKTTPTIPTSPQFPFTFDTCSVQVGGVAVDIIETLTVEFDNQLEGIAVLNASPFIAKVRRSGAQLVRISGTIAYERQDEYNDFINQTNRSLSMSFTKADSFKLVVDVPRMLYTAFPVSMPGRDRLLVDFEAKGYHDAGSGFAIRAQLTSVLSGY